MIAGRFRALTSFIRRGRETEEGTGQALRDAYSTDESPMDAENAAAIQRCIEALNDVEFTLARKIDAQKPKRRG